ncbi:MAG: hypothetical protein IKF90_25235, partial [Parasporobacterium sp.]|nr:hypothetical protein [Parasporobacterium sp.]
MQDDYNNNRDPYNEDSHEDRYKDPNTEQYERKQDIPRWTPYEDDYQSPQPPKEPRKPDKQKKRWVIPLVIVLAIMVAAITVGVIYGTNRL